jgi:hypothetical protein
MSRIPSIQSGITRYFDGPPPYETKKQWIRQGTDMRVYVRNCPVAIDGKWFLSIVIANIEVAGHLRGQGYYRDFEAWLEGFAASHHYIQLIYYEHVINRDLARMLQKHNYTVHRATRLPSATMIHEEIITSESKQCLPLTTSVCARSRNSFLEINPRKQN